MLIQVGMVSEGCLISVGKSVPFHMHAYRYAYLSSIVVMTGCEATIHKLELEAKCFEDERLKFKALQVDSVTMKGDFIY